MTVDPAGTVSVQTAPRAPIAEAVAPAMQSFPGEALLYGESGLVLQSAGAVALISQAAVQRWAAEAAAADSDSPLVAPAGPVVRVVPSRRIDVLA